MGVKKVCLVSVVRLATIKINGPFTCTLDSKKLERQIKYCFILFVKSNDSVGPNVSILGYVEYIATVLRRFELK